VLREAFRARGLKRHTLLNRRATFSNGRLSHSFHARVSLYGHT
jgi:hypothetical protein